MGDGPHLHALAATRDESGKAHSRNLLRPFLGKNEIKIAMIRIGTIINKYQPRKNKCNQTVSLAGLISAIMDLEPARASQGVVLQMRLSENRGP